MSSRKIKIWGRELELNIVMECYPGEEILKEQQEILEWLLSSNMLDSALESLNVYVKKTATIDITIPIDNIYRYVMPKTIFVPHKKTNPTIAILCNYKYDMEHGIAIVFENGCFKDIGTKDIIL